MCCVMFQFYNSCITPELLNASRAIKVRLTGNLDHLIVTNPFFFGLERHYVRAQIARISHSTTIIPRGLHKLTDDSPTEIEPIEDLQYAATSESQSELANWVHASKSILKCGRVSPLQPDSDEFEGLDPDEVSRLLFEWDPPEPRLKPLSDDVAALDDAPAWTLRVIGAVTRATAVSGKWSELASVVVRSEIWPGSLTCWKRDKQLQFYVGDGLKRERIVAPTSSLTDENIDSVKLYTSHREKKFSH